MFSTVAICLFKSKLDGSRVKEAVSFCLDSPYLPSLIGLDVGKDRLLWVQITLTIGDMNVFVLVVAWLILDWEAVNMYTIKSGAGHERTCVTSFVTFYYHPVELIGSVGSTWIHEIRGLCVIEGSR